LERGRQRSGAADPCGRTGRCSARAGRPKMHAVGRVRFGGATCVDGLEA
jgi:hypothetical protein